MRLTLLAAIFAGFCVWAEGATAESTPASPNVLLILVDDLGYGDLSS